MCPTYAGILGYPAESFTNSLSLAADPLDAENTPSGVFEAVSTEVQILKLIRTCPMMDLVYIAGQCQVLCVPFFHSRVLPGVLSYCRYNMFC
jgi:hypothetical protein